MENGIYYSENRVFRVWNGTYEEGSFLRGAVVTGKPWVDDNEPCTLEKIKAANPKPLYSFWNTADGYKSEFCSKCAAEYTFNDLQRDWYLSQEYASFNCSICYEHQQDDEAVSECDTCGAAFFQQVGDLETCRECGANNFVHAHKQE